MMGSMMDYPPPTSAQMYKKSILKYIFSVCLSTEVIKHAWSAKDRIAIIDRKTLAQDPLGNYSSAVDYTL